MSLGALVSFLMLNPIRFSLDPLGVVWAPKNPKYWILCSHFRHLLEKSGAALFWSPSSQIYVRSTPQTQGSQIPWSQLLTRKGSCRHYFQNGPLWGPCYQFALHLTLIKVFIINYSLFTLNRVTPLTFFRFEAPELLFGVQLFSSATKFFVNGFLSVAQDFPPWIWGFGICLS